MTEPIRVSAVVLRDADGRVLTVRKRGTTRFMFPGGKLEPGESAAEAAVRETHEEVGVRLAETDLRPLGTFLAAAANEPDRMVEAVVFEHPSVAGAAPAGEIDELRWQPTSGPYPPDLAPLLAEHVLPALDRRRVAASARLP